MNFLKPYIRGWLIIAGAMVIAYVVAAKYLSYVTPMYESTSKLRLADLNEGVPNSNLFKDLDIFVTTQKINAEIELLKSHVILGKALDKVGFDVSVFREGNIKKTELFHDSPILIRPIHWEERQKDKEFRLWVLDSKSYSIFTPSGEVFEGKMGKELEFLGCTILVDLNKELLATRETLQIADHYIFSVLSRARQISSTLAALDVVAVDKDVPVIRISFKSSHPEKAALLPNALAEAYINDYIENKFGAANVTADFLDERIKDVGDKLANAEEMILNYRDDNSITNIQQETETDLRKISQMKIQQTNLKMTRDAIRDLEAYILSGQDNFLELAPNFEAFTDLLSTEIVKNIKQLQAEKKDLLLKYTASNERVKVVDEKIKDLTSYLTESIRNTRKNLEVKYDRLVKDIEDAEKVFIDVPEKERMITILRREFEIYQQSYNFLNEKRIEAEIARSARISFHRLITPASVSKVPVSPNTTIIKIVAIILGMLGGVVLIFIVHTLKARVNDLSTVESNSNIPVLLSIPRHVSPSEKEEYFLKSLTEMEVKKLIHENSICCLTGFNREHGQRYLLTGLEEIMKLQHRRFLTVHLKEGYEETRIIESPESESARLFIHEDKLKGQSTSEIQQLIRNESARFDFTIIDNSCIGKPFTLAVMSMANLNLICIDTRLTPASKIHEVNQLNDEFKLENIYLAVNRVGYTPNFIRELAGYYRQYKKKKLRKSE